MIGIAMIWRGFTQYTLSSLVLFTVALSACLLISQLYVHKASTERVTSHPNLAYSANVPNARYYFQKRSQNRSYDEHGNHPPTHFTTGGKDCSITVEMRFDCARDRALSEVECEKRGCCYVPSPESAFGGPPWCFYPNSYPGYRMGPLVPTSRGQKATLTRATPSYLPRDISTLQLEVMAEDAGHLHLTLKDPSSDRYEVPFVAVSPGRPTGTHRRLYDVEFQPDPFGFIVRRRSNGRLLLNTTVAPLLFADQYLQLSTMLVSSLVSGLGEHYTHLTLDLNWTSVTLWNKDMAPHSDANLYGSHPFCLVQEGDGHAHGIFLLNSNAMEVSLQPAPAITWVTIGGILDFYIFLGPDPQSVVQQYHQVIGYPMMPPYWSLGFHLCRWGYTSSNITRTVVQRMHQAQFPLDVQWNDLDYADKRRVFTFDPQRFGDLPEMVKEFHQQGIKYVLILDPGISSTSPPGSYKPFDEGERREVFIRNLTGQTLIGKVWPGATAFPDFTNPDAVSWWEECIRDFHANVSLDGLWIDMNEPASFVQGSVHGCPYTELENPPYVPDVLGGRLNAGTLCMTSLQDLSTHYNLHNLYGLTEAMATYSALLKARRSRPFVLSRSSFPGLGRFAGHWTGDVRSDWEQLRYSIPGESAGLSLQHLSREHHAIVPVDSLLPAKCRGQQGNGGTGQGKGSVDLALETLQPKAMLLFGIYGVPLVGADVCGFGGDTNEELCVRWTQLGAFYPFMRNHNDKPNASQEPYVFGQQAQAAMRSVLILRYSLLPFLYTLFHFAHTSASTVARPLFLEFPFDPNCQTIDRQFLWGSSLLISPVLEPGALELAAYLPPATWYSLHNGQPYYSKGQYLLLPAPLDTINIHVREGHIIPQQVPALTTAASRNNPFRLTVALSSMGWTRGELFWDDGDSLDTFEHGDYSYIIFTAGQSQVVSQPLKLNGALRGLVVEEVRVFGIPTPPPGVWANGEKVTNFSYCWDTMVLTVPNLTLLISEPFTIKWSP